MKLLRGQRAKLAELVPGTRSFRLEASIEAPGLVIDLACFGLDADGRLSDERYMTFFNQPMTPCGAVHLAAAGAGRQGFAVDLDRLPASIARLTLTATIDGVGVMSAIGAGQVGFFDGVEETARFTFSGGDFANERALMLLEIYRKDGDWRACALGQGFDGGLEALVRSFGGTVADEPAQAQSASAQAPSLASMGHPAGALSLEKKVEREAPRLVSLAKKAAVSLEKQQLAQVAARVGLVLDASGSMTRQYKDGRVQELVDRVLPLAVHFDDDGALDCWVFGDSCMELPPARLDNCNGYVAREAPWASKFFTRSPIGGTNNEVAAIETVTRRYRDSKLPAYVIFVSDGGVHRNREIEALIREASSLPIFWQFVGLGGHNYGILERLDELTGRTVDNCNFFALDDLRQISEAELYDRLLNEFPTWLGEAKAKGILG